MNDRETESFGVIYQVFECKKCHGWYDTEEIAERDHVCVMKPCPWCGTLEVRFQRVENSVEVWCCKCGATGPRKTGVDGGKPKISEALALWDERKGCGEEGK